MKAFGQLVAIAVARSETMPALICGGERSVKEGGPREVIMVSEIVQRGYASQ